MTTMFSRTGRSSMEGKLTHRLDIPVSEELHDAVTALATIQGQGKAEWIRELVSKVVWGELAMLRRVTVHTQREQWDDHRRNVGGADE